MLHRRSALRISCVTLAFVLASCERDATAPNAVRQLPRQSQYVTAPPITVYGPATFTRTIGKPRVDSASFNTTAGDTVTFTFESSARLGAADTVEFNDQTIFTVTDTTTFPARVHAVTWAVNTLRVLQAGKPGSNLTIVATVAPPPPPSAPWWNAFLDFNGGVLPTGWDTRLLGGDNPGLVHDRLESQPVDNGPWVRSIGPAPAGLLGIVVEYDGQAAQSTWGNGQAIDLWTGNFMFSLVEVIVWY